jgi:hypothetical protein
MSIIKVSEFASLYGLIRNNVYTYGKRKKLIIENGSIDTENPLNKLFIETLKHKTPTNTIITEISTQTESLNLETISPEIKSQTKPKESKPIEPKNYKGVEIYEGLRRVDALKEKKLIAEIEEIELRNKVKVGELIPKNFVTSLFQRFVVANTTSFYNASDNLLMEICEKFEIDIETSAKLKGRLKEIVNTSIENAQAETKKDIIQIIKVLRNG